MTDQELDRILDTWDAPEAPASLRRGLVAALPPRRRAIFGVPLRWAVACAAAAVPVTLIGTSLVDPKGNLGMRAEGSSGGIHVRMTAFAHPPIAALKWRWKTSQFAIGPRDGVVGGTAALSDRVGGNRYGFDYSVRAVEGGYSVDTGSAKRVVRDGDAVDVEVYRAGEERVFVHLEVASRPFDRAYPEPALTEGQLRLSEPKLIVNGAPAGSGHNHPFGPAVWVTVPGHPGRYLIALDARGDARFAANGRVDGKALEFQAGADRVRIECVAPIATRPRGLYVFEDKTFQSPVKAGPVFGSAPL